MTALERGSPSLYYASLGEVSEWLKEPVSKTGEVLRPSRVRIPPSPLPFPGGLKPGLGPYGTCPEGHGVRHVFQDESQRVYTLRPSPRFNAPGKHHPVASRDRSGCRETTARYQRPTLEHTPQQKSPAGQPRRDTEAGTPAQTRSSWRRGTAGASASNPLCRSKARLAPGLAGRPAGPILGGVAWPCFK